MTLKNWGHHHIKMCISLNLSTSFVSSSPSYTQSTLCKHNYDISIYMVSLLISPPGVKNILFRGSAHLGHGAHKVRTGIVDKEKDSFCADCISLPAKRWWHALHQTPTAQPDVGFRWQTDAVWFPRKERREMKWGCVWGGGEWRGGRRRGEGIRMSHK